MKENKVFILGKDKINPKRKVVFTVKELMERDNEIYDLTTQQHIKDIKDIFMIINRLKKDYKEEIFNYHDLIYIEDNLKQILKRWEDERRNN